MSRPCHRCGLPAYTWTPATWDTPTWRQHPGRLTIAHLCITHLDDAIRNAHPGVNQATYGVGGYGLPDAPCELLGEGNYRLTCHRCQATWSGMPFDACGWCQRRRQLDDDMRLTLALQPPDPLTPERFALWATRLGHLVDSGDITEQQAGDAVDRTARLLERTTA